nr:SEC-C metal-binding domain-containing protein [Rufibacter ruber]
MDVLVIFANRAIVIQAKSKKLTIAARKGNDNSLRSDFKKAVQEAYDQAYLCSTFLNDINYKFIDKSGLELKVNRNFKEIYPICIVSEQYPALSFQARQFLDFKETNTIMPPFVMNVFLLDVMTELLQSPLYFLSYINRRTSYGNKIHSTHELTILAYHLKKNLWMDDEYSMMYFEDDIGAGLDLAMLSRRDGVPGLDTPDGILTLYKGSYFDNIITDINKLEHPTIVDLGFLLLSLSGETIDSINKGINYIKKQTREDGLNHDITLAFGSMQSGLTIHCNNDNLSKSTARLDNHCRQRKYKQKAKSWFGICIGTLFPNIRFGTKLEYKWEQSAELDNLVKYLPNYHASNSKPNFIKHKKIKRNEKCLCGSGKKYKNCCLE